MIFDVIKSLAMSHAASRKVNGLSALVQMKRKQFLGNALKELETKSNIENRYECKGLRMRQLQRKINPSNYRTKEEKDKRPQSAE